MIRKLQVLILILLIPLGALYIYSERTGTSVKEFLYPGSPIVHIGTIPLQVLVADTPELRQQGLSGRDSLGDVQGMLFIFDENDYHGIWMKDMKFPIDVIWIDESLTVVSVTENLQPSSYPKIFEPPKPVRYIIETNVYFSDSFGIREGDKVDLPLKYR